MCFPLPLVHDGPGPPSPWLGCSATWGSCLSRGHRSPAKVEQSETAGSKAATVQLAFMLAAALIFSLCAFYGSVEEKANSEVRGHCVNQRHVFFIGDAIVHANNNKISGTDITLGLLSPDFSLLLWYKTGITEIYLIPLNIWSYTEL